VAGFLLVFDPLAVGVVDGGDCLVSLSRTSVLAEILTALGLFLWIVDNPRRGLVLAALKVPVDGPLGDADEPAVQKLPAKITVERASSAGEYGQRDSVLWRIDTTHGKMRTSSSGTV
jgi:hypothetical protein